jgi:hypothetical protein
VVVLQIINLVYLIFPICVLRFDCASKMAAGTIPASFISLRRCDSGLGFGKSIDFVRVSDLKRMNSARRKVSVIRSSNPSQDIAKLQPASKGSQLLGMNAT